VKVESVSLSYGTAIRAGFAYLLTHHPEVFVMGQGLWSPWYVGNSMGELEIDFGKDRVIDTPVSEQACTGAAVGAAVAGRRPIVVHPRMDFMLLAVDQIVTQAAKWSSMFGGRSTAPVVIRGIVNRGGEQGAQHSQALHSWFAHIPGLRVAMPASVADARDLLVSAALCGDPVLYIDDRWLYELSADLPPEPDLDAIFRGPRVVRTGHDLTLVAASYGVQVALDAAARLSASGVSAEVVDLRTINPLNVEVVVASVEKTGRLIAVDAGWTTCGLAGEIIASVAERLHPEAFRSSPRRVTLQDAPAPTSGPLEKRYYPSVERVLEVATGVFTSDRSVAILQ
jgi:acetoin:2,6-dichlorophenolindophenol oxidoreductase subunit beta